MKRLIIFLLLCVSVASAQVSGTAVLNVGGPSPLHVSATNPLYFEDASGQIVYLAGMHTNVDVQTLSDQPTLDYAGFINRLVSHNMNYLRLWVWEQSKFVPYSTAGVTVTPNWYLRSLTCCGGDGLNKFDTTKFNDAGYFANLRSRIIQAQNAGIYVSVMLFQGFSVGWGLYTPPGHVANAWPGHPYNANNNINSLSGDPTASGQGGQTEANNIAAITAVQDAYIQHVVAQVGDLPNIIWEIGNEMWGSPTSTAAQILAFQNHVMATVRAADSNRHPVVMVTFSDINGAVQNADIFGSTADMVSPGDGSVFTLPDFAKNLAGAPRPVLLDTDHIGFTNDPTVIWDHFIKGYQALELNDALDAAHEPVANAIGDTLIWSKKIDLKHSVSQYCTTAGAGQFCLVNAGVSYLGMSTTGGTFAMNMSGNSNTFGVQWYDLATRGPVVNGPNVTGGSSTQSFTSPFGSHASVLLVK